MQVQTLKVTVHGVRKLVLPCNSAPRHIVAHEEEARRL